ncbi:MAG: hypothetical protein KC586_24430, partial [Myxococcales bacterium]|nr:hypothetical protein [Myxococcales bacterium]
MQSTTTGRIVGTPWYMSPEQAAGAAELGPDTDVWAAGAMLYECLAGRRPFEGPTPTAVLMNVLRHDAPVLSLPEAPHVAEAIRRAMSKGDDRFRTASELRAALHGREAHASSGMRHASSRTPSTPVTDPNAATLLVAPRNTKARWLAVALVALAGVVGALAWRSNEVTSEARSEPTAPAEVTDEVPAVVANPPVSDETALPVVVANPPALRSIVPDTTPTDAARAVESDALEPRVETASQRPPRRAENVATTRRVAPAGSETTPPAAPST